MPRVHGTPTDREFALNEAAVFNEANARDLNAALAWGDESDLRAAAEHAVRMCDRVSRFIETARYAA